MLSRRVRSAVAAVLDVARLARGKPLPAKELAASDGLAPRQLESVLQDLVRAGLLRSIRGPRGGYELARERRRISIGDIVRAIGPEDANGTAHSPPAVEAAIAAATEAFMAYLDQVTIEELCRAEAPVVVGAGQGDFTI